MNTFYQEVFSFIRTCYEGAIAIDSFALSHPLLILNNKEITFLLLRFPTDDAIFQQQAEVNSLANGCELAGGRLIVIWEDRWRNKHRQVMARIASLFGHFQRIHARQTKVVKINQTELDSFMHDNHLYGSAQSKHKYGLLYKGRLVAAASFSGMRKYYRDQRVCRSSELVRFANLNGYCVVGGMGKLLKHFVQDKQPDDIMTYADRDWSVGNSFQQLGFMEVARTPSQQYWLHPDTRERYAQHRLPKDLINEFELSQSIDLTDYLIEQGYVRVFDNGNIKYLKTITHMPTTNLGSS